MVSAFASNVFVLSSNSCRWTLLSYQWIILIGLWGEREREGVNAQKYTGHHITKLYWVFLYCHTFHIELAKSYNKQAGLTIWPIKLQHRGQRPEDYRCFRPPTDHPLHTASNRFLLVNSWRSETHPFMPVPLSGNMQAKRQDNAWYSHHMRPPRARVNRTISNTYGNKHHWAIPEFPAYKRSPSSIFTHTYIYIYTRIYWYECAYYRF